MGKAKDWVEDAFTTAGNKINDFADTGVGQVANLLTGGALEATGKGLSATGGAIGGNVEDMADVASMGVYSGAKQTVDDFREGNVSGIVTDLVTGGGLTGYGGEAAGAGATRTLGEAIENGGITLSKHSDEYEEESDDVPASGSGNEVADQDETKTNASSEASQEGESTASQAAKEALAIGSNPANANDAATSTSSQTSNSSYNNAFVANSNAKASTQADYLSKMGYTNALAQQAENIKKGAGLNIASGILQGVGAGASAGAGFSDENLKEAPSVGGETIEHLAKVLDMMTEVQRLKKGVKSR